MTKLLPIVATQAERAAPDPRSMAAPALLLGGGVSGLLIGAAALDPGIGPVVSPIYLAAALVLALVTTGFCLPLALRKGLPRVFAGAILGMGFGAVQILAVSGMRGSPPVDQIIDGATVLAGGLTGALIAWVLNTADAPGLRWSAALPGLGFALFAHAASALGPGSMDSAWPLSAATLCLIAGLLVFLGLGLGMMLAQKSSKSEIDDGRFRLLAEVLPVPIILSSAGELRILFANERSRQELQLREPVAQEIDSLFVNPEDRGRLTEIMRRDGLIEGREVELRRADSSQFWALVSARPIQFGGVSAIVIGFTDITDRKAAEEELMATEVRYALISRASSDGIWDWDIPTGQVYYSSRWREIVGAESTKKLNSLQDWLDRLHPEDSGRVRQEIDDHIAGLTRQLDTEYRIRHGDGRYMWMQCRGIALRNNRGEPIRMAGSQSDITLRKTYEINLLNAAYEDQLTGVNNRAYFEHLVDSRVSDGDVANSAIVLVNLDRFRRLNDNLGSAAGDALLIAIARRLVARATPSDALSRLGADEFAIWVRPSAGPESVAALADRLLVELSRPCMIGDVEIPVSVSIGFATPAMGDAKNGFDLLRNARLALDRAKTLGGGRVEAFNDDMLRETNLRRRLSVDLTSAEREGQISFEYQAVVALEPGGKNRIAGFESLMRWQHPELGRISPVRFIPIAEESGMIGPLGLHAIEAAAREIGKWSAEGLIDDRFSIAVNLSARQISDRAGVARLNALLDRLRLPHGRLKLEITESVLMSDPETMTRTLQDIRARGVGLSLDDFGTGYSSLSYLHRFPLDVLKIDRSFVSRMGRTPEAARLVNSIIELAHDLGLSVVAEGVETEDDIERLRDLRCDYAQGYYFSRPVPPAEARALLTRGLG